MDLTKAPEAPFLFHPATTRGAEIFAKDSLDAHKVTSRFAERMWDAINVIVHDSQAALAINCKELCNPDILARSRKHLEAMAAQSSQTSPQYSTEELSLQEDHYNFMGYCTAVLSRVHAVCAPFSAVPLHPKACPHFIAALAKISAKLKIVSNQRLHPAQSSLTNCRSYMSSGECHQHGTHNKAAANGDGESLSPMISARHNVKVVGVVSSETRVKAIEMEYYLHTTRLQYAILELLRIMLSSVRLMDFDPTNFERYEISAAFYTRPLALMATLVFRDLDQSYSGSSDPALTDRAWAPIIVTEAVVSVIHQGSLDEEVGKPEACVTSSTLSGQDDRAGNSGQGSPTGQSSAFTESLGTEVHIVLQGQILTRAESKYRAPRRTRLRSMSDVISVVVPLMLATPRAIIILCEDIRSRGRQQREAPCQQDIYFFPWTKAIIQLNSTITSGYLFRGQHKDAEAGTLLYAIRLGIIYPGTLETEKQQMDSWAIQERGVMVNCKKYVAALMTLCASLACGCIAMGLAVGTRIPGVDPFNLASFSWILAAFVMLIGKSIRVRSWCWHDFVHGRVFCQSLSELSSVTRIDAQHIFIKLFDEQSLMHLQTRGPYNAIFTRKSDDGFAIDVPLAIGALLNCGLVMVRVLLSVPGRGALLVCLDLRQGRTINVLPASYNSDESGNQAREWIYSQDDVNTYCDGVTTQLRRWHTGRQLNWGEVTGLDYIQSSEVFT